MSFIKEYKTYSSLTPEQKRFVEDKYIEASRTPSEWLAFFARIAEYDRHGDSGRKLLGRAGIGFAIAAFVSIFVSVVAESFIPSLVVWPIAILMGLLYLIKKKSDLPNKFREFVVPLVSILREEMRASEPLFLHLDFRGGTEQYKQTSGEHFKTAKRPASYVKADITERFFSDIWIEGRARLADDSRLELAIVDHICERKVGKRNARGKYKTKTKYKIKSVIEARLQLPQEDYALMGAGGRESDRIRLKSGEKRNAIRVRRVVKSSDLNSVLGLNHALDVIARAYKNVAPNRAGGK
jgi:hypothetical protein